MKFFFLQKKQKIQSAQKKGFTLLETLIAVTILVTALVGPMAIASNGLISAFFARDQVTAFYLAQEGIEYVRYVRDTNTLRNQSLDDASKKSWLFGLSDCIYDVAAGDTVEKKCQIDVRNASPASDPDTSSTVSSCSILDGCSVMKYDDPDIGGTGMFQYSTGGSSRFTREISITKLSTDQALIESTITWRTGVIPKTFSLKEVVTNWQQ